MNRYFQYFRKNSWVNLILILNVIYFSSSCKKKLLVKEEFNQNYANYVVLAEKYYDNNQLESAYYYLLKIKKIYPTPPQNIDSTLVGLPNTLLGFYFEDMNQPDSALYYHNMAYQDRFHYFGENHPETSKSVNNLGYYFKDIQNIILLKYIFQKLFLWLRITRNIKRNIINTA
jgi:hypothetical protein